MYPPLATKPPMTMTTGFSSRSLRVSIYKRSLAEASPPGVVSLITTALMESSRRGVVDVLANHIGRAIIDNGIGHFYHANMWVCRETDKRKANAPAAMPRPTIAGTRTYQLTKNLPIGELRNMIHLYGPGKALRNSRGRTLCR